MTENSYKNAIRTYKAVLDWFEDNDVTFDRDDSEMCVSSYFTGEDLKMNYTVRVNPEREVLTYESPMPFTVPKEKAVNMAFAVAAINERLANGCFLYDMNADSVRFKMTTCFTGASVVTEEMIAYMIITSTGTVEEYNDKLFLLTKGILDYTDFIE